MILAAHTTGFEVVGVNDTEDPKDGHEEHKQDHDGHDSPWKKDTIA